jgi:cytidylate kinase
MKQKLLYKNITISGLPGAGSSTLGKALAKVLKWKYFSGGDFLRAIAIKQGVFDKNQKLHHDQSILDKKFDLQVDYGMRETLQNKTNNILDSWLSGFMAQGVKGTLKILVHCKDPAILIDRIANRDNLTIKQAKKHIFERQEKNVAKWKKMYHKQWNNWVVKIKKIKKDKPIWFWYPELYDLSIDTYQYSKEETLDIALKKLNYPTHNLDYKNLFSQ